MWSLRRHWWTLSWTISEYKKQTDWPQYRGLYQLTATSRSVPTDRHIAFYTNWPPHRGLYPSQSIPTDRNTAVFQTFLSARGMRARQHILGFNWAGRFCDTNSSTKIRKEHPAFSRIKPECTFCVIDQTIPTARNFAGYHTICEIGRLSTILQAIEQPARWSALSSFLHQRDESPTAYSRVHLVREV